MAKLWRRLAGIVAACALFIGLAQTTQVHAADVDINATAAVAVEAQTGKVLYSKNAQQVLPLASMTKLLGIYLVHQAIADGKLQWTDTIKPSASITKLSNNTDLSNVPFRADGTYTVRQLYQAALIDSANAAMMLLGNKVAGSQTKFVDAMRAQLQTWGINDATIINATGLDNSAIDAADRYPGSKPNAENTMSANDVAKIAQHLLHDYPQVLETTKLKTLDFVDNNDKIPMTNYNAMLPGTKAAVAGLNVDGLKTGTTDRAGDCFTGTVEKNGMRIITVVMHANGQGDNKRFVETGKLMNWVFANWKQMTVTTKGQPVRGHASLKVKHGTKARVGLKATKTLKLYVPAATTAKDLRYTYTAHLKQTLEAPVQKNAKAGSLTVGTANDTLGYLNDKPSKSVTLVTAKQVKRNNTFKLILHGIGEWFSSLF
ncbi:serine hydrolase [Lacticaseibacillus jixiensis]|uniref:serine hydrolase n=1 Tax=Lacticaseibacillus jixiensis TaxID=3231926 RepID=UPI0036F35E64